MEVADVEPKKNHEEERQVAIANKNMRRWTAMKHKLEDKNPRRRWKPGQPKPYCLFIHLLLEAIASRSIAIRLEAYMAYTAVLPVHPLLGLPQDQPGATKSSCAPCELQGVGNIDCPVSGMTGRAPYREPMGSTEERDAVCRIRIWWEDLGLI